MKCIRQFKNVKFGWVGVVGLLIVSQNSLAQTVNGLDNLALIDMNRPAVIASLKAWSGRGEQYWSALSATELAMHLEKQTVGQTDQTTRAIKVSSKASELAFESNASRAWVNGPQQLTDGDNVMRYQPRVPCTLLDAGQENPLREDEVRTIKADACDIPQNAAVLLVMLDKTAAGDAGQLSMHPVAPSPNPNPNAFEFDRGNGLKQDVFFVSLRHSKTELFRLGAYFMGDATDSMPRDQTQQPTVQMKVTLLGYFLNYQ
jgi:hypothetical protein